MIEGVVNAAREAVVTLPLQGPAGQTLEIDAVVDTGFNRFLTLPQAVVTELGLAFAGVTVVWSWQTAVRLSFLPMASPWCGTARMRDVVAYSADTTPLIGMALLDDHDLSIQVRTGGRVVIQAGE